MKVLTEIGRETYGHGERAINRHSARTFADERGARFILSKTLDGCPPFFEAYGPFEEGHQGALPRLKVQGKEYWGDGWSWRRALKALCGELAVTIGSKKREG